MVVTALDRLGRSLSAVIRTVQTLTAAGVLLRLLRDGIDFIGLVRTARGPGRPVARTFTGGCLAQGWQRNAGLLTHPAGVDAADGHRPFVGRHHVAVKIDDGGPGECRPPTDEHSPRVVSGRRLHIFTASTGMTATPVCKPRKRPLSFTPWFSASLLKLSSADAVTSGTARTTVNR